MIQRPELKTVVLSIVGSICIVASAGAQTVGAGTSIANDEVDTPNTGGRINVDNSNPISFSAGTYLASLFAFDAGQPGDATPFLAIQTGPNVFQAIAVGATQNLLGTERDTSVPFGGSPVFTLATATTVYAGIASSTQNPVFLDNGVGLTDHEAFVAPGYNVTVGGTVPPDGSFSHADLGRAYAFSITVGPALEWDTITNNGTVDGASAGVRNWFDADVWRFGGANRSWNNGSDSDAIFGAAPGTVMLGDGGGTGVTVDDLRFQVDGYSIVPVTGQALRLGGGEGAHVVTVNAGTATIETLFDTSGEGFDKAGAGTLVLSNPGTLGGTIRLNAGTVRIEPELPTAVAFDDLLFANNVGAVADVTSANVSVRALSGGGGAASSTLRVTGDLTVGSANSSTIFDGSLIAGRLTKVGDGTLTLTKSGLFFQGAFVNDGVLEVSGNVSSNMSSVTIAAGAALRLQTSARIGLLSGNGSVEANGNDLEIAPSGGGTSTFSGEMKGAGSQLIVSGGTLSLTGASSFTGAMTIRALGDVTVATLANSGINSALGAGDTIILRETGGLLLTGSGASDRSLVLGAGLGVLRVEDAATVVTLNGEVSGPGDLAKAGPGTLTLTNLTNSFGGALSIQGKLMAGGIANAGVNSGIGAGSIIVLGAQTAPGEWVQTANGDYSSNRTIRVEDGGGVIRLSTLVSTDLTLSGAITGTGPLTFAADSVSDTITLNGLGSGRAGDTVVDQVHLILNVTGGDALPLALVTLRDNVASRLEVQSSESIGSLAGGAGATNFGRVTLGNSFGVGGDNLSTTFAGLIEGSGLLIKRGTGTWALTRANTFTGGLIVENGAVAVASLADTGVASPLGVSGQNTLGTASVNGTLRYTGTNAASTNRTFSLAAGGGTFDITDASAVVTLNGGISGTGGLTKRGPGSLLLTNAANSFDDGVAILEGRITITGIGNTTVNSPLGNGPITLGGPTTNGELELSQIGNSSSNRAISVNAGGGTVRITSSAESALVLSGAITGAGPLTFVADSVNDTITLNAVGSARTGATIVDQVHLILNVTAGDALPTRLVTLRDDVSSRLEVVSSESIGSLSGGGGVTNFGRVTLNNDLGVGGDDLSTTFNGLIEGTGALIKRGTGTLTLTGANTFTGGLRIENGAIAVGSLTDLGGASPLGGGEVVVSDSTLRYTGTESGSTNQLFRLNGVATFEVVEPAAIVTLSRQVASLGHSLFKSGPGTLALTGGAGADVTVTEGRLEVHQFTPGDLNCLETGTLAVVDRPSLNSVYLGGGVLSLENLDFGAARPQIIELILGGGTIRFDLAGNAAGTDYDQIRVSHQISFIENTIELDIRLGFNPVDDTDVFTLIDNDGSSSFDPMNPLFGYGGQPLANGAQFLVTTGQFSQLFMITYHDNDLRLFAVPEPGSIVLLLLASAILSCHRPSMPGAKLRSGR